MSYFLPKLEGNIVGGNIGKGLLSCRTMKLTTQPSAALVQTGRVSCAVSSLATGSLALVLSGFEEEAGSVCMSSCGPKLVSLCLLFINFYCHVLFYTALMDLFRSKSHI